MRFSEITEDLSDLFGKGSDIGKMYNPGVDPEIQSALAAKQGGGPQFARPTQSGAAQDDWDANMAKYFNPDGTPKNVDPKGAGSVRYASNYRSKTRNKPVDPRLIKILKSASAATGLTVEIFSGGQDAKGSGTRRTGSTRHDNGLAADVYLYDAKGNVLNTRGDDPRVVNFVAACRRAGAKGLGAHPGYMGGTGIHVDIVGSSQGGGSMWGAGGTGSPPQRIAQAFQSGKGTTVA